MDRIELMRAFVRVVETGSLSLPEKLKLVIAHLTERVKSIPGWT